MAKDDLISRNAAIEEMRRFSETMHDNRCKPSWYDAVSIVKDIPAVEAVPVVRCRDCEFYGEEPYGTLKECYRGCGWTKPIDYCSRGKRRESE